MAKSIVAISGSPRRNGNTMTLLGWFLDGVRSEQCDAEVISAAFLELKASGCTSCRSCQKLSEYECVIDDGMKPVLQKIAQADVIVMATPLYFFSMSAQIKAVLDRMFSLYKWDNAAGTMRTVLTGKKLILLASAYEDAGLDALEAPFKLTAEYSGMDFESLIVPGAGVSGEIRRIAGLPEKVFMLGKRAAGS